jgi:hypothetical protein
MKSGCAPFSKKPAKAKVRCAHPDVGANEIVEVRRLLRHRSPFIFGAPHFDWRSAGAIVTPMAFIGFQASSRPARIADEHIFWFFSVLWRDH